MRTGRSSTVCWRSLLPGRWDVCSWGVAAPEGCLLPGGGCLLPGGVCSWGSALGGVCSRGGGVYSQGGCLLLGGLLLEGVYPACTEADTPTLLTESQTPVKTLPWLIFVAAGKNTQNSGTDIPQNPQLLKIIYKSIWLLQRIPEDVRPIMDETSH